MTICLALKLPWPGVMSFGPDDGVCRDIVAFATDSRWKEEAINPSTGKPVQRYEDAGDKLFQISRNAMFAYAGNVFIAHRLVEAAIKEPVKSGQSPLGQDIWIDGDGALDLIKDNLKEVHRKAISDHEISRPESRIFILLAFADNHKNAVRLFRFDTGTQGAPFDPYELGPGIYPIGGNAEAREHAKSKCLLEMQRLTRWDENPVRWAIYPALGVESAVKAGAYNDIGGLVQQGVVDRKEAGFVTVAIREPGNPGSWSITRPEGRGWVREEAGTVREQTKGKRPF